MENKLEWYVLQVYSNSELAVKRNIEAQQDLGFYLNIKEIYVPIEEITSISEKGKKTLLQKALYAGYIYLRIENYSDKSVTGLVNISKVSKMVGYISDEEVKKLKNKIENTEGKSKYRVSFDTGDMVLIKEGPFSNFKGEVDEFLPEKNTVKVQVDIFGRKTDVELAVQDVELVIE
jgi:transcriptional antiterminator NusG